MVVKERAGCDLRLTPVHRAPPSWLPFSSPVMTNIISVRAGAQMSRGPSPTFPGSLARPQPRHDEAGPTHRLRVGFVTQVHG